MRRTVSSIKPAFFITATLVALSALAFLPSAHAGPKADPNRVLEPKEYDRLDGHGLSHKKVDVIEWENNLEIHVYPKGSLKKLGLKLDPTDKKKPVMVIEYSFNGVAYTLIRRAILGIPMNESFKTYYDTSASDYDKVMISPNALATENGLQAYPLAPPPVQLYPDYADAIGGGADDPVSEPFSADEVGPKKTAAPVGGSQKAAPSDIQRPARSPNSRGQSGETAAPRARPSTPDVDSNGGIKSFSW